jgi:uncharacterized OB-fold protein
MPARPIAPDVLTTDSPARLIGGRHRASGRIIFPLPQDTESYERIELPSRGTLWSYTVQRFPPKSPPYRGDEPFQPFGLGYVELPGALIVASRLTEIDFRELRLGLPLELTTTVLRHDEDGTAVYTYAFRPVRNASG